MSHTTIPSTAEQSLAARVRACYQCGKCSAGCPMGQQMDLLPNQLMRLVQLEKLDRALASDAIWQCVACMTCSARCPQAVDCAGVMDELRQMSAHRGVASAAAQRTLLFQQTFLENIRRNGRLRELELIGIFKAKAFLHDRRVGMLMKDALLAPKMMKRGKFHWHGEAVKDRGVVRRIFARCEE
jgi:heterodisulfide reductase subunit C2